MKSRQGYVQGYNAQAVVSEEQIIVAVGVTQEANDVQQLEPMLQTMAHTLEAAGIEDRPKAGLADAGYWSEANIRACPWPEMPELLIATTKDWKQRKMLREKGCPRGRIPKGLSPRDRMERKLLTKRGRALYKKRGVLVEPVFGQVKEGQGFDCSDLEDADDRRKTLPSPQGTRAHERRLSRHTVYGWHGTLRPSCCCVVSPTHRAVKRLNGSGPSSPRGATNAPIRPRVRGNLHQVVAASYPLRSIPACAGEPVVKSPSASRWRVYPRVCRGTPAWWPMPACSCRPPSPGTWACGNSSTITLTSAARRDGRTLGTRC